MPVPISQSLSQSSPSRVCGFGAVRDDGGIFFFSFTSEGGGCQCGWCMVYGVGVCVGPEMSSIIENIIKAP